VVGYDDNAVAKTTTPRLTTVRQPLELMGEMAARLLVDAIRTGNRNSVHKVIPFEVVERESVAQYIDPSLDRLTA